VRRALARHAWIAPAFAFVIEEYADQFAGGRCAFEAIVTTKFQSITITHSKAANGERQSQTGLALRPVAAFVFT
jgi:hypothetical protein